jgi:hypothetical protein
VAGEKDAESAPKLGQLQPFIAVFPQECTGQLASFWASLTPLSLQYSFVLELALTAGVAVGINPIATSENSH